MSVRQKILITLAVAALVNFLVLIFFADKGYFDLSSLKASKKQTLEDNEVLVKQNISLYRKIEKLKHDPEFIEHVARKELGLVGKGQVIFQRNPSNPKNIKKDE
ncbi:MAG: septum formation initiator family protein [Pseudomonadota bacterium]